MPDGTSKPDNQWHLDKRIPVALIATILAMAVTVTVKFTRVEEQNIAQDEKLEKLDAQQKVTGVKIEALQATNLEIATIKEQIRGLDKLTARLERIIERFGEREGRLELQEPRGP